MFETPTFSPTHPHTHTHTHTRTHTHHHTTPHHCLFLFIFIIYVINFYDAWQTPEMHVSFLTLSLLGKREIPVRCQKNRARAMIGIATAH